MILSILAVKSAGARLQVERMVLAVDTSPLTAQRSRAAHNRQDMMNQSVIESRFSGRFPPDSFLQSLAVTVLELLNQ